MGMEIDTRTAMIATTIKKLCQRKALSPGFPVAVLLCTLIEFCQKIPFFENFFCNLPELNIFPAPYLLNLSLNILHVNYLQYFLDS